MMGRRRQSARKIRSKEHGISITWKMGIFYWSAGEMFLEFGIR